MRNHNTTLITITSAEINGELIEVVDARELHAFLEVRSEFRNWIKNRIDDFGFVESQDFITVGKNLPSGGRRNDYFITIDMAKELSMVERNEKGKQARRYFIECERRAKSTASAPIDGSKITAELALAECYTRMLRPAPSSQVLMLQTIAANNGLNASFLPSYAIDAPSDSTTGSSEPTASLTSLLKENGIRKQAKDYNLLLQKVGFLERRERKSKSGSIKQFWIITELGERYGKNITSAQNSRETQPHWYVSRFDELHSVLTSKGEL